MTSLGPAAIALGFAVFANYQGGYLKDSDDEIEYVSPDQPSLYTGGCSRRCMYGMMLERYPDIVIGESYSMDAVSQALQQFDPKFENPQARECLHVPIERRPWGNRGRGGYMPGPQPGCKDNGTDIDYPPIVGLSPQDFRRRQTYPPPLPKWTPHEMPKLLIPDNWTFPYISYLPKIPYVLSLTDPKSGEGINVTYPKPEVAESEPVPLQ